MAEEQLCNLYSQKGRNHIIFTKVLAKKGLCLPLFVPRQLYWLPWCGVAIGESQPRSSLSLGRSPVLGGRCYVDFAIVGPLPGERL